MTSVERERQDRARLREEYFDLLPHIRRVAQQLEAEIRFHTLPILHDLRAHEQLIIRSRIKECESALKTLLGPNDDRLFDPDKHYAMQDLPDLAGVRVLAFPNKRLIEIDYLLRPYFEKWEPKHLRDDAGALQGYKYFGYCKAASADVKGEYQIVPMLLGLFWEVEHSAMYKSATVANSKSMQQRRSEVERSLANFEEGIADLLP